MFQESAEANDIGAMARALERTAEDVRRILDDLDLDAVQSRRTSPPEVVGRWPGAGSEVYEDAIGSQHRCR